MGWNEPGNGKGNDGGPPDLDEALKRFQKKLKTVLGGSSSKSGNSDNSGSSSGGLLAALGLVVVVILWALSGIFIVGPAERAVVLKFGKYIETVGPGPHWIPSLVYTKIVKNVDRVSDYSYSAQMLTKDENLVSVSIAVQYRIGDLENYLFNVSDSQESLQQATSSALRQVVGSTSLNQIITEGREAWGNGVSEALTQILDIYKTGIIIVNVSPQPARAPDSVQDAFDDAIKAQEDEKRFKEQAGAYAARVIPVATGNAKRISESAKAQAQQVVLRAKGETAEFLELLPEYLRAPEITGERMYFDAMQRVLVKTSKIVVDGKSGNLMYLPLDKLALNQSPSIIPGIAERDSIYAPSGTSKESSLYDGRDTVRPTERLGRSN